MKTKKENPFVSSLALGLLCIIVACFGCTSAAPQDYDGAPAPAAVQAIARCASAGPCVTLHIENRNLQAAGIYIDGGRFAYVDGMSLSTVGVPLSRFDAAGCIVFFVRLAIAGTASTSRECVEGKNGLVLKIDETVTSDTELKLWLYPAEGRDMVAASAQGGVALFKRKADYFYNVRPVGRDKLDPSAAWVVTYPHPLIYDKWWREIAACEGIHLDIDKAKHVRFVYINAMNFHLAGDESELWGLADPEGMTIYLSRSMMEHKPTVTHEMVHMADAWNGYDEGVDFHPADRFETCGLHTVWP